MIIKLKNFETKEQKKSYTCGYATLSMICNYFENNVEEEVLESELPLGNIGTTPPKFKKLFKKHVKEYTIKTKYIRKSKFIEEVQNQLEKDIPIPFIYFTKNKFGNPKMVGHYSNIIGIDTDKSILVIADPFFKSERKMSFEEAYKQLSFKEVNKDNTVKIYKYIRMLVMCRGYITFMIYKKA